MHSIPRLRPVLRRLSRSRGFALVALLTLAIGVGTNVAVFSVVHGVLLQPLPYPEPDRLVGLWHEAPALGFDEVNQSPATYLTYRDEGEVFDDVGMWDSNSVSITGLDQPVEVEAMLVTDGTLPLLGASTAVGRLFTAEDDSPDSPETVILGHDFWLKRFGGERDVLGRSLQVDGREREIVGVMQRGFRLLDHAPAVYLPFRFDRSEVMMGNFSYQGLARLVPGATLEQANAEVERLIPVAAESFPGPLTLQNLQEAQFGAKVRPLEVDVVGDIGATLWVLMGTVGIVLLIACANVANLFLVRAERRQVEIAVRRALGADRKTVFFEHLSESLVLAVASGLLGLGLAAGGLRLLRALEPRGLPRLQDISVDPQVIGFTGVLTLMSGLLLGLASAVRRGPGLNATLREGGRGASTGKQRFHARNALVVGQMALALVLLVGSGLLLRSFEALRSVNPGFALPEDVLTVRLSLPEAEIEDSDQVIAVYRQMATQLAAIPGVARVGAASSITMDGWASNDALYVDGFPMPEGQLPPIRRFKWITEGYFEAMGNPLVAGRDITWGDIESRAHVVVITENLALEYWRSAADAIGRQVRPDADGPWRTVVGVVGDVHDDGTDQNAVPVVFWPMALRDFWDEEERVRRSLAFALRCERPIGTDLLHEVQTAVWSVNSNIPLANLRTLGEILDRSMARTSFTLVMLGLAAGVAVLLGLVGIFGVTSYAASLRTREIGVRMALGARKGDVRWMVLRQALVLAGAGAGLGLVAAAALTRTMTSLLFGVSAFDPLTYAGVALLLVALALGASYLPAYRAAGLDPIYALRQD
ncbi:MAG: ABC transporter permease [Thermoanaerobaculia bacterium]|nr:ABC transporter permease [Thermoanaerobaculia bacterium]